MVALVAGVITLPLLTSILVASAMMFLVGYNTSVLNPVSPYCFPNHTTLSWSIAVSAFAVGGPVGSYAAGKIREEAGVKGALQITLLAFCASGVLQTFAMSVPQLTVSRAVAGLASGSSTVLGEAVASHLT